MARGGARANKPGDPARPNRTDMPGKIPISVAPSTSYGSATASRQAQQAVPLANPTVAAPVAGQTQGPPPSLAGLAQQAGINGLQNPSQRPNEPVTAGLATGAGPGPEALGPLGAPDDYLSQLRAIYLKNPTEPIRQLIQYNENPNGV